MRACAKPDHPRRRAPARESAGMAAIELPGSSRPEPHATWRSLDAEIGGPVRGSGDSRRGLRRYEPHDGADRRRQAAAPAEAPASAGLDRTVRVARAAGEVDLFSTTYAPEAGTPGGTVIIGDWQEATQFNPYYLSPGHRGQRRLARLAQPADDHQRLPVLPAARGRADPDDRQRRRHGRRGRRRDDGHLEAP